MINEAYDEFSIKMPPHFEEAERWAEVCMNLDAANPIRASIVVPARNEAAHIRTCLDSLLSQSLPEHDYEVIVVNGNSTDITASIVRDLQKSKPNLRLIENPAGYTPIGMNLGIRAARGDVIIIAGAHSTYPQHFVKKSLEYLDETGADVVGGPITPVPLSNRLSARLNSVILSSRFGVGNSRSRTTVKADFVDSVFFGAYKRQILQRVGFYNERLRRNQDNDLSARIRAEGGRIYLTPDLTVLYHPTGSFFNLVRKVFRDSRWHFISVRENPRSMAARHFAPSVLLVFLSLSASVGFFIPQALWALSAVLGVHLVLGCCVALSRARDLGFPGLLVFPLACISFHIAYGAGTLVGIFAPP